MWGTELPANDHIIRYVKPSHVEEDGSVDCECFCLRSDEAGLSVYWLEIFGSDRNRQLDEVRRRCPLRLRPNGKFARLSVGETIAVVKQKCTIRIVHDPLEADDNILANPSHSLILGLPSGDSLLAEHIGDLIVDRIVSLYPAIE